MPDSGLKSQFRRRLLAWYDRQKRDLPWRATRDPYCIWVSEIMLQQTQVNTVLDYYRRWTGEFPTLESLARAPLGRVLKLWEGLGYYSRARNLHRAAQLIAADGGRLPETHDGLVALPGIGRYTAGALLSIAFGKPAPVVDGNVRRVLSRLLCLKDNGGVSRSTEKFWSVAGELVPRLRPGDFNQALMELGATVCLPRNPLCPACPVAGICASRRQGAQQAYPQRKRQTPAKKLQVSAAVILKNGKVYIQQRPNGGLMGGLWEFPGGKLEPGESPEAALRREIREEMGISIRIEKKILTVRHAYTRFRVTLHVFLARPGAGRIRATQCERWRWAAIGSLGDYPYPAANLKIVEWLRAHRAEIRTARGVRAGKE